ncbi:Putative cyclase [Haladaptatus litoreus]|uniref:Putative cyclase n=2 Tax=Haladaptatus litoreus TaxID=553468 RepID=A0A1N7ELS8_9EURY|nr:Putative cyclase [Haladaptatus litoreus]
MTEHTHSHDCCNGIDRRRFLQGCGAVFALAAATTATAAEDNPQPGDLDTLLCGLPTNWGRWGESDELGALNFLGSRESFDGMKAAMKGGSKQIERFTLQLSVTGSADTDPLFVGRFPARKDNTLDARFDGMDGSPIPLPGGLKYADDTFVTRFFLQGTTHVDALGHAWYGKHLYNGYHQSTTATATSYPEAVTGLRDSNGDGDLEATPIDMTYGLGAADITAAAGAGIAGRGVLLDVGRHIGDDDNRLPTDYGISLEDLLSTAEKQETDLRKRDIILIRTGSVERARDPTASYDPLDEPGLVFSEELVQWFHEMETPVIGADNVAIERASQMIDGSVYFAPLHGALLRNLGISLLEILDLQSLSEACATDGIYDFLFTTAPLNVPGGTGAPANPVVLKATRTDENDDER